MNIALDKTSLVFARIAERAIMRSTTAGREIISRPGGPQDWLIDLRPVFLDPAALDAIATLFWDRFEQRAPSELAGMEPAAIPQVTGLLLKTRDGPTRPASVNSICLPVRVKSWTPRSRSIAWQGE